MCEKAQRPPYAPAAAAFRLSFRIAAVMAVARHGSLSPITAAASPVVNRLIVMKEVMTSEVAHGAPRIAAHDLSFSRGCSLPAGNIGVGPMPSRLLNPTQINRPGQMVQDP